MAEFISDIFKGMPWYLYLILLLAIGLLIASFIIPPLGIIDPSVIKATALIMGGTWLFYVTVNIPVFLSAGAKIKASYGDATIEIGKHKAQEQEEDLPDY